MLTDPMVRLLLEKLVRTIRASAITEVLDRLRDERATLGSSGPNGASAHTKMQPRKNMTSEEADSLAREVTLALADRPGMLRRELVKRVPRLGEASRGGSNFLQALRAKGFVRLEGTTSTGRWYNAQ